MNRRLMLLVFVLVVLTAGSLVWLRTMDMPSPTSRTPRPAPPTGAAASKPTAALTDPAGYDTKEVTLTLPPRSAFPDAWWQTPGGCVHTRLRKVLGANISSGGGVIVFALEPGKPAAQAGILPGDRLGLNNSDCPSTLYPSFTPAENARTMRWTVRRPRSAAFRRKAAEEAAAHPMAPMPTGATSPK